MTPITILTGFLGSGKTTLLARMLRKPDFSRTAVIINEFGEIGLDHDLIEAGDDNIVELTNGCLCCRVQSDLSQTLRTLNARRAAEEIAFDRAIIETSGLADPIPIIHAIATDPAISAEFLIDRVITTVDSLCGADAAEHYDEARKQIAMADLILLTKGDLASRDNKADIERTLNRLNQWAPRIIGQNWEEGWALTADRNNKDAGRHPGAHADMDHAHGHAEVYSTVCIVRDRPVSASAVPLFLEGLAAHEGKRLLRMKGLIQIAEIPECPMVIHGVQHVFHQPVWLDEWPSNDRRTRIVMIGHGLSERWAILLLEAIEAEVDAVKQMLSAQRSKS